MSFHSQLQNMGVGWCPFFYGSEFMSEFTFNIGKTLLIIGSVIKKVRIVRQ